MLDDQLGDPGRLHIAYRRPGAKPHDPTVGRCQKAQFTIKPICERNCLKEREPERQCLTTSSNSVRIEGTRGVVALICNRTDERVPQRAPLPSPSALADWNVEEQAVSLRM